MQYEVRDNGEDEDHRCGNLDQCRDDVRRVQRPPFSVQRGDRLRSELADDVDEDGGNRGCNRAREDGRPAQGSDDDIAGGDRNDDVEQVAKEQNRRKKPLVPVQHV